MPVHTSFVQVYRIPDDVTAWKSQKQMLHRGVDLSLLGKSAKDSVPLKPLNHEVVIHYNRTISIKLFSITPRAWEPAKYAFLQAPKPAVGGGEYQSINSGNQISPNFERFEPF